MGFFKRLFGPKENEQHKMQQQMNDLYRECIKIIDYELFRRLLDIVEHRYPEERPDPIAAHAKLCCTSEGPNEKSLQNSTEAERAIGRTLADEIMAIDVPGLYGVDIMQFVEIVKALPEDAGSIRRLALCFDQYAAILILSLATDISNATRPPIMDQNYILTKAVPLVEAAERYDPTSAILQTTIAQTFYSGGNLERGMAAAERATELDPSNAEGWRLLGNAYMMKDDNLQARKCLEHALNLEPNLDGVHDALRLLS